VGTWFEWLKCFVVISMIVACTLLMVSMFIIRSRSFDEVKGQLSAYTFFYKVLEGEEILSLVCWAMPHRDKDYRIGSNFCKFYLIKTSFTLNEQVYLMKVFKLFKLK